MASDPRRVEGASGLVEFVRAAQSRGECPGESIILRDGRLEGAWVEVVGARDEEVEAGWGCMRVFARTF